MKLYRNTAENVGIAIKIVYFQKNIILLDFHVDITKFNEIMNSVKYNGKKINFINPLKIAEKKIFHMCRCI